MILTNQEDTTVWGVAGLLFVFAGVMKACETTARVYGKFRAWLEARGRVLPAARHAPSRRGDPS